MDAVGHRIGAQAIHDTGRQCGPVEPDVDHQHPGSVIEAIEMRLQEGEAAVAQPQAFPDAVTEHEPRIEHRHLRLLARDQGPVDRDQDRVVAHIADVVLGSRRHCALHGPSPPILRPASRASIDALRAGLHCEALSLSNP